MTVTKNGVKWYSSKWMSIKSDIVKNKKHQLYEYVKYQQEIGNQDKDDFYVSYFLIYGRKITPDDLYRRFGILGFDAKCENYPKEINCYTDYFSIYNPVYCELDEYGEKLRVWKTKE